MAARRYRDQQTRTSYAQANTYLTAMKASQDLDWLNEVSSVPLQQAIRRVHPLGVPVPRRPPVPGQDEHTAGGEKIPNPHKLARRERNLARYQRRLARCQKGSANRAKARAKIARAHRKVRASGRTSCTARQPGSSATTT